MEELRGLIIIMYLQTMLFRRAVGETGASCNWDQ